MLALAEANRTLRKQFMDGLNLPLIPHFFEPTFHQCYVFGF
jgi:hypothetical protein